MTLKPSPLVLLLHPLSKVSLHHSCSSFRHCKATTRSPQSSRLSNPNSPNFSNPNSSILGEKAKRMGKSKENGDCSANPKALEVLRKLSSLPCRAREAQREGLGCVFLIAPGRDKSRDLRVPPRAETWKTSNGKREWQEGTRAPLQQKELENFCLF